MSLLQSVEKILEMSGVGETALGDVHTIERDDGTIEVWPTILAADPVGSRHQRGAVLARCLTSLQASGLGVELVCRGDTFVRCRS